MSETSEPTAEPKKRGRKQKYPRLTSYQDGAPLLTTRIDPDKLEWVKSRPEGTRPYLERIIGEDRDRTEGASSLILTGLQEQAAEA